jgi:hypothetical protein
VRGRGLPDGAVVVFRVPLARCLMATLAPAYVLLIYAWAASRGIPASGVVNPRAFVLAGFAIVALALVFLPPGRRVQVAGGAGWIACRRWPLLSWRVTQLTEIRRYHLHTYATRGPRMARLRMIDADGVQLTVTAPASQPWLGLLVDTLAAQGAQRFEPDTRRAARRLAVLISVSLLPLAYLAAGSSGLLPERLAGAFRSSACRAALTAEKQGLGPAPSWGQTLQPGAETWHLVDHVTATVAQVAGHTADPSARLEHLTADGATGGYQVTYLGPDGSRIAVDAVTFGSPTGAVQYLHYVNRATCDRFSGTSGPAPGEVRWTSGKTYGFARWAGRTTVYDVSPVLESPEATRTEVDALAAAAQATANG